MMTVIELITLALAATFAHGGSLQQHMRRGAALQQSAAVKLENKAGRATLDQNSIQRAQAFSLTDFTVARGVCAKLNVPLCPAINLNILIDFNKETVRTPGDTSVCNAKSETACCVEPDRFEGIPAEAEGQPCNFKEKEGPEDFSRSDTLCPASNIECHAQHVCCVPKMTESKSTYTFTLAGAISINFGIAKFSVYIQGELSLAVSVNMESDLYKKKGDPGGLVIFKDYILGFLKDKFKRSEMHKLKTEYGEDRIQEEMLLIDIMNYTSNDPSKIFDDSVLIESKDILKLPKIPAPKTPVTEVSGYVAYIMNNVQKFLVTRAMQVWGPCAHAYVAQEGMRDKIKLAFPGNSILKSDEDFVKNKEFIWSDRKTLRLIKDLKWTEELAKVPECAGTKWSDLKCLEKLNSVPKTEYLADWTNFRKCAINKDDSQNFEIWKRPADMVRQIWVDVVADLFRFFFTCPLYKEGPDHPCTGFSSEAGLAASNANQASMGGARATGTYKGLQDAGSDGLKAQRGFFGQQKVQPRKRFSSVLRKEKFFYAYDYETQSDDWVVSARHMMDKLDNYNLVYKVVANDGTLAADLSDEMKSSEAFQAGEIFYTQQPGVAECRLIKSIYGDYIAEDNILKKTEMNAHAQRRLLQAWIFCRLLSKQNFLQIKDQNEEYYNIKGPESADDEAGRSPTRCIQFRYSKGTASIPACLPSALAYVFKDFVDLFTLDTCKKGTQSSEGKRCIPKPELTCPELNPKGDPKLSECRNEMMQINAKEVLHNLLEYLGDDYSGLKKMRLPDFLVLPGKFQEILKESVDSGEGKKRVEAMEAEEKKLNWYNIQAETTLTVGVKLWLWGGFEEDSSKDDAMDICPDPAPDQATFAVSKTWPAQISVYSKKKAGRVLDDSVVQLYDSLESPETVVLTGLLGVSIPNFGLEVEYTTRLGLNEEGKEQCTRGWTSGVEVRFAFEAAEAEDDASASDIENIAKWDMIQQIVFLAVGTAQSMHTDIKTKNEYQDANEKKGKSFISSFASKLKEGLTAKKVAMAAVKGLAKYAMHKALGAIGLEAVTTKGWPMMTIAIERFGCSDFAISLSYSNIWRFMVALGGEGAETFGVPSFKIMYYSIQTSGIRFNAMQKTLKEEVETAVKQAKDQIDLNKAAAKTSNEAYQQNTLAQPDDAFTSTTPPVKVAERHGGVLDTSARVRETFDPENVEVWDKPQTPMYLQGDMPLKQCVEKNQAEWAAETQKNVLLKPMIRSVYAKYICLVVQKTPVPLGDLPTPVCSVGGCEAGSTKVEMKGETDLAEIPFPSDGKGNFVRFSAVGCDSKGESSVLKNHQVWFKPAGVNVNAPVFDIRQIKSDIKTKVLQTVRITTPYKVQESKPTDYDFKTLTYSRRHKNQLEAPDGELPEFLKQDIWDGFDLPPHKDKEPCWTGYALKNHYTLDRGYIRFEGLYIAPGRRLLVAFHSAGTERTFATEIHGAKVKVHGDDLDWLKLEFEHSKKKNFVDSLETNTYDGERYMVKFASKYSPLSFYIETSQYFKTAPKWNFFFSNQAEDSTTCSTVAALEQITTPTQGQKYMCDDTEGKDDQTVVCKDLP